MSFNPNYVYGTGVDQNSFASTPAQGRRVVTADFAILYINNVSIGLVQRFTPTESRPVAPQYEIGNIYPVEFVPQPWSGRIQVQRLEIFKNALYNAFGFNAGINTYGLTNFWPSDKRDASNSPIVTTLADIQWPLDMSIHIANPALTNSITVKTYIECWITEFGTSYDSGAKVVAENVSFTFRNTTFQDVPIDSYNFSSLSTQAV
jgi:hypothetical protein